MFWLFLPEAYTYGEKSQIKKRLCIQAGVHSKKSFHIKQQVYPNRWFSLDWCTQRPACLALLQVFRDLSQPELQVHPLCLLSSTGFLQMGHALVQGGLPLICSTETQNNVYLLECCT